ncbi:hypothetical protein [Dictyobacter arantiisoli]|uniref:Uncharacterized protein n=1 Tax=Dictyobacter arantiisoli TaxID=2014874 RepID=A0A5A5TI74_9CHLR|nr:hypothetical protein [Dictyobacter arantiisoli]GCF11097.1 hypothetical protein KDI_46610 [Dictyobacter arantiisoli]
MENNDNHIGAAILKIMALTGGAIAGAMIANWCDKLLYNMAHTRSDYDKTRYEQGLAAHEVPSNTRNSINTASEQSHVIRIEHPENLPFAEEG